MGVRPTHSGYPGPLQGSLWGPRQLVGVQRVSQVASRPWEPCTGWMSPPPGDRGRRRDLRAEPGVRGGGCCHRTAVGLGAVQGHRASGPAFPSPDHPSSGQPGFRGPALRAGSREVTRGPLVLDHKTQSPVHLRGQGEDLEDFSPAGVGRGLTHTQYTQKCHHAFETGK